MTLAYFLQLPQCSHDVEKKVKRIVFSDHCALVLKLELDLGTLNKDYDAFKVFIGKPEEFPVVKKRSLKLQPGKEHFVELKAQVGGSLIVEAVLTYL